MTFVNIRQPNTRSQRRKYGTANAIKREVLFKQHFYPDRGRSEGRSKVMFAELSDMASLKAGESN